MGTLCVSPLSVSYPLLRPHGSSSRKTHLSDSILWPRVPPPPTLKMGTNTVVFGANSGKPKESMFTDENGVVDDMDGYLNYLSLEYDSVWDTKPSWCQPWTITLTGVSAVACSWLIFHSLVVSTVILLLVCAWWYIFLYSYPKAYVDMITERRKNVTNGVEDTFGLKKKNQ